MHGQVEALAQRGDELRRRRRSQKPRHVLDRDDVRPRGDDLGREVQVVVERVEILGRVQKVAGVAERHLGDCGARVANSLDGRTHLLDVVERIEDPEDVDPARRRLPHEGLGHGRGVGRVAHGVASTQKHLDRDVRKCRPQLVETLPGVFPEEAQCDIVGRPSPGLD